MRINKDMKKDHLIAQSPHTVGYKCLHKGFSTNSTSAQTLWTPAAGMKVVITDIQISTDDENTAIIYEGTDSTDTDYWVCKCHLKKDYSNNITSMSLLTPYVSYTPNNPIKLKLSLPKTVFGVIYGYEIDSL